MEGVNAAVRTVASWLTVPARQRCSTLLLAIPALLLSACDPAPASRLDLVAGVDVCQLISQAEAEQILGPTLKAPAAMAAGPGIAGNCTWSYRQLSSGQPATLFVTMVTRASSPQGPSPGRFLAVSEAEISASLGADPWPLEDLGDRALLFQTSRPEHSELYLLQSETLLTLRIVGGSAAQLERFARALSRELAVKP